MSVYIVFIINLVMEKAFSLSFSNGVGRTATFIVIDILLKVLQMRGKKKDVNAKLILL